MQLIVLKSVSLGQDSLLSHHNISLGTLSSQKSNKTNELKMTPWAPFIPFDSILT